MKPVQYAGLVIAFCLASSPQGGPEFFQLVLPTLNKTIGSGNVVADIPAQSLSQTTIQLLGSADKNLGYGDVHVKVNGKGVGNIFDSGSNDRGKFLSMNASTLRMRPDQIFDPTENTLEVYGKDKRGRAYYQNWILRSGSENVNAYFSYVSQMSPSDEIGLPPDLTIDEPKQPILFTGTNKTVSVRLKGSASAAPALASLTIGGKPIQIPARSVSTPFDQTIAVARGETAVTVEATDPKGNRRSISIPVIDAGTRSPKQVRMSGERFAVVIGVSRFTADTGAPPPLRVAAYDAKQLASTLKNHGFKDENIRLLTDEQATVEQVRTALGDFTARAKPDDFLAVFFATQGVHDPSDPEKVYLTAADSQRKSLGQTAIEISELQLLLNRAVRCRHTLLFFDAEHPLGPDWAFQGKPIINTYLLNLFDGPLGRSVLVSSAAGQDSQEQTDGEVSRSLFAIALGNGLSGQADVDHNGVITARELCTFVAESVRNSSKGLQAPQYHLADTETETPILALAH